MKDTFIAIDEAALKKRTILYTNPVSYIVVTMLGGLFVGFGIILLITIGGLLDPTHVPSMKIIQGMTFGVALSMVVLGGADLFTGNNFVMTVGALNRQVKWMDVLAIWFASWGGNLVGSLVCGVLYVYSGLVTEPIHMYIEKITIAKVSPSFSELFVRGILCNILVCLAVWCSFKLKNEVAKIAMIFCCIFPFITSGFEHSVANMTLFSIALLMPSSEAISVSEAMYNLSAVTLGNAIGGAIVIGLGFWLIYRQKAS